MTNSRGYLGIVITFSYVILSILANDASSQSEDNNKNNDNTTLRLVSMLFRHGDRTMDRQAGETYENDPYKDYDTYPIGDGQLTNIGKARAYRLGTILKDRYNEFLGDIYYQPNIYARSTNVGRCKMTLQLVLAALYPPVDIQKWHPNLSWQPANWIYSPVTRDGLLLPMFCTKYNQTYLDTLRTKEVRQEMERFRGLMKDMSVYTGNTITSVRSLFMLYHTLTTESSMGLSLPEWTTNFFPLGSLYKAAILQYYLLNYNNELIRLNSGKLLYKIVTDMDNKISGNLKDRKLNLFSGHDTNVASLLLALNIFDDEIPAFTSAVIIELHEINEKYYVKVLRYLGLSTKIIPMSISGCDILCPFDKFHKLIAANIGSDDDPTCPLNADKLVPFS